MNDIQITRWTVFPAGPHRGLCLACYPTHRECGRYYHHKGPCLCRRHLKFANYRKD